MNWRRNSGLGVTWANYVRGEYPSVSGSIAMMPNRCALRAAWYTPILSERKARRVFDRMRDRLATQLAARAEVVRGSGDEKLLRAEHDRLRGLQLVFADKVPCQGARGCYRSDHNAVYFKRSTLRWRPGSTEPFDPYRQLSHGAVVHEVSHAAAVTQVKVTRYLALPPGQTSGVLVDAYKVHRRQPHGHRFAARLAQAVRAWCETEGKPVCVRHCASGR